MKINKQDLINITPSNLLKKINLFTPPYSPFHVAKKLGLEVDQSIDFRNMDLSGFITRSDEKIKIWINPFDSVTRQRFTLAHELGHYINDFLTSSGSLIWKDNPNTLYRNGNRDPRETAANKFAAGLLMPKDDVISKAKELVNEKPNKTMPTIDFVTEMAEIFEVSKPAMLVRLKVLGIVRQDFKI